MRRPIIFLLAVAAVFLPAACVQNNVAGPTPTPISREYVNDPFLDTLQQRTFAFFWERTNPVNGLTPDRWPTKSFSSVAAVGFALTAYPIGVERNWVTRDQAATRTLTTLRWFYQAPQSSNPTNVTGNWGFFYHFLDMDTGYRFQTVELSTIDTALLLGGVLFVQQYFDRPDSLEGAIRAYADSLYRRTDWTKAIPPTAPRISMGWKPEEGWFNWSYNGYNEAMLLYVLALGSPTYPIDASAWPAFTSTYHWGTFHGQTHVNFAPLFGHQYSHVWIDFRGIQDAYMRSRGIDYFENSRRATLSQRAYAVANPGGWRDYSGDVWGLTANDGPSDTVLTIDGRQRQFFTYRARGAAANEVQDDGTIAPTAAASSIPFAPEIAVPATKAMRVRYGNELFQQYGFLDGFNPTFRDAGAVRAGRVVTNVGWFDNDYLGIDQGPILAMVENYRTGLVWNYMKRSPYIRRGLERAGFTGGWLVVQ